MATRGKRSRKLVTRAYAQHVVRNLDSDYRAHEADKAQAELLHALAFADMILDSAIQRSKYWRKEVRATEIARAKKFGNETIRHAVRLANAPTQLSRRLSGQAIEHCCRIETVPRRSRRLVGAWLVRTTAGVRAAGSGDWGPDERSEAITLRNRAGGILAHVIVAGAERDLLAKLLAVLMNAAPEATR